VCDHGQPRFGPTKTLSERRVRAEARAILDQLEKGLDNWYGVFGLLVLAALAGIGPYCWFKLDMGWWQAGAWGVGGTVAVTVAGAIVVSIAEQSKARRARRRFDLRFPEGTERRRWTVGFLSEFTPTNDGAIQFLSEVLPASMRSNVYAANSGIIAEAVDEPEAEPPGPRDPAPRRRSRGEPARTQAIPVDLTRDPDALIPLELPPDVQRKQRR
jgi:hypothetical protein